MSDQRASLVNDPATVRREYATEDRFLARRLANWAELLGPLVEEAAIEAVAEGTPTRASTSGAAPATSQNDSARSRR